MAKVVVISPQMYLQGQVTLYQGDQWNVFFQIVDFYNGVSIPTNLSNASGIMAFFPAASGGSNIGVAATVTDATQGLCQVTVPPAITTNLGPIADASSWYVQAQLVLGLLTIPTLDMPLVIAAPGFTS